MRLTLPTPWGRLCGPASEIERLHRQVQVFRAHSPEALAAWVESRSESIQDLWRVEVTLDITIEVQADRIVVDLQKPPLDACWIEDTRTIRLSAKHCDARHIIHELAHAIIWTACGGKLPGRMGEELAIKAMGEII